MGPVLSVINHVKEHSTVYAAFEIEQTKSNTDKASKCIKHKDIS